MTVSDLSIDLPGPVMVETTSSGAPPQLPVKTEAGSPGCSMCQVQVAQYSASKRRLHVVLKQNDAMPTRVTVLVSTKGAVRRFTPPADEVTKLQGARSADWYLPQDVLAPFRVVLVVDWATGSEALNVDVS
jgi:hypothetical protein